MAYATTQDLTNQFSLATLNQLLPVAGSAPPAFDTARATTILASVSNFMDSYIGMRYTLPLAIVPTPPQIVEACCDITYYRMYAARPLSFIQDARMRYEDAIKYLEAIAGSNVTLGTTPAQETALSQAATVQVAAPPRNLAMNSGAASQFTSNPIQQYMGFGVGPGTG